MAISEIDKDGETEKKRERLSYMFVAFAACTLLSYMFLPIQEAVRSTVGNAVFVILGYVTGVNSYWFNASPASKKTGPDNSTNTVIGDNVDTKVLETK